MPNNSLTQLELMQQMVEQRTWSKTPWTYTTLMAGLSLIQQQALLMVTDVLAPYIKRFYDMKLDRAKGTPKPLFSQYVLQEGIPPLRIWLQDLGVQPSNYEAARRAIDEINMAVDHPEFDDEGRPTGRILRTNVFSQFGFKDTGDWYSFTRKDGQPDAVPRKTAYIDVKINPDAAQWAFDMSKGYVNHLKMIALYSTKRSTPRIYLLLMRALPKGAEQTDVRIPLMELKEYLGISATAYPMFSNFKQKVLDAVQKDLQRMASQEPPTTDITFTYNLHYPGTRRKGDPEAVVFHVKHTALGTAYNVVVNHAHLPAPDTTPDMFAQAEAAEPGLTPEQAMAAKEKVWERLKQDMALTGADVWFGNYKQPTHTVTYVYDRSQPQLADRLTTGTEADQFNAIIRQYFGQSVTIHLARQGR